MNIYGYENFGYEGEIISVEVDVRDGIPSLDIVGRMDDSCEHVRTIIRGAFDKAGLDLPDKRILVALSPADVRKSYRLQSFTAALAIALRNHEGEPVMAIGGLNMFGDVCVVDGGLYAAVTSGRDVGIKHFIVPSCQADGLENIEGVVIHGADTFAEACSIAKEIAGDIPDLPAMPRKLARAIEIAMAGDLNMIAVGAPGCGKSLAISTLVPLLKKELAPADEQEVRRIYSIVGLGNKAVHDAPFRMPHQTATVEGIYGGGPHCYPGEVSLADKGTLFLDEAMEFRSSVLQMLRAPMRNRSIVLSRAWRTTRYPADFQLMMATSPCPCGCLDVKDSICLCSSGSINLYWSKSRNLLDYIEIKIWVDEPRDEWAVPDIQLMKRKIVGARNMQVKTNRHLGPDELKYIGLSSEAQAMLDGCGKLSTNQRNNILKVALTIAQMEHGVNAVGEDDMREALDLTRNLPCMDIYK